MIRPILPYGDVILRKATAELFPDFPNLPGLISDMYETMYAASGVGLAAPQIGESIRLFIVDGTGFEEDEPGMRNFKQVFINPVILEEEGEEWAFNEGCLSIPGVREDVVRKSRVLLEFQDEKFEFHEAWFDGMSARIIQHEYDHLEGILFTDKINPMRKKLIRSELEHISRGNHRADYKMKKPFQRR
ncbi:MAG: peptide deformylase [Bacteroidetes bacterium]|jgi:peptide deformylase|nr:peptide deformylase [Bacteroidota bacterium]